MVAWISAPNIAPPPRLVKLVAKASAVPIGQIGWSILTEADDDELVLERIGGQKVLPVHAR
jgi:hypothetical protein